MVTQREYEERQSRVWKFLRGEPARRARAMRRRREPEVPEVEETLFEIPEEPELEEIELPEIEKEYASDIQIRILREAMQEGTLPEKAFTRELWLSPEQALELGYEAYGDLRILPKGHGEEPTIEYEGELEPIPIEFTEEEISEEIIPEFDEETISQLYELAQTDPDRFKEELIRIGRTPELENILTKYYQATPEDLEELWGDTPVGSDLRSAWDEVFAGTDFEYVDKWLNIIKTDSTKLDDFLNEIREVGHTGEVNYLLNQLNFTRGDIARIFGEEVRFGYDTLQEVREREELKKGGVSEEEINKIILLGRLGEVELPISVVDIKNAFIESLPLIFKEETKDEMFEYLIKNPNQLRQTLIYEGRNKERENLVRQLFPGITEQELDNYFSLDSLAVEMKNAEGGKGFLGTFTAGVGDIVANIGGIFRWAGSEGIGNKIIKLGQYMQVQAEPIPAELETFNWKHLFNPKFYATHGVRMIPNLMLLAVPSVGAYGLAGNVVTKFGLGAFSRALITGIGGAALSRPVESAFEAAMAYDEARNRGLSHEEAEKVAWKVFTGNLTLIGTDAVQIAAAFMPTPFSKVAASVISKGLVKTAMVGGKLFFTSLTEGGEEYYQEIITRQALGEEIDLTDPEMQLVFALGSIAGIGMGGGGDILMRIQNRVINGFSEEQKTQFDDAKQRFMGEGLSEDVATNNALNEVIENNPELEKNVEEAVEAVKKELQFEQVKPKDEAERIAFQQIQERVTGEEIVEPVTEEIVEPIEEAKPKTIRTGEEYTATVYRGRREEGVPIDVGLYGKGTYYATSKEYAETYDGAYAETVTLKNPFVINTQAEAEAFWDNYRGIREEAIAEGKMPKEVDDIVASRMREELEAQGYDGLIARGIVAKGDEVVVFYPEEAIRKVIPTPEPGMPEAGLQTSMLPEVAAREVRPEPTGKITQATLDDYLRLAKYKETPVSKRIQKIKNLLATKGRLPKGIGTKEELRLELARLKTQQDIAGFDSIEDLERAIEEVQYEIRLRGQPYHGGIKENKFPDENVHQLEEMLKVYEEARYKVYKGLGVEVEPQKPAKMLSNEELMTNLQTLGGPNLSPAQIQKTLDLFGHYVMSPDAKGAWELTQELRREDRAARAEALKERTQKYIVDGMSSEDAMRTAIREILSGEYPTLTTDYLSDLTEQMREVLFAKVYLELRNEPLEMASTVTALTNALLGKPIPREPGVKGGSAYKRLQRVFGGQPQVFKALEKASESNETLEDVIEGIYHEIGRPPTPIDKAMAEYLRNLNEIPYGVQTIFDKPTDLKVSDLRTPAELEYAKKKLDLDTQFARGEIDETRYKIEVSEAYDKAFPKPPIPPYDPPIAKALEDNPLWPKPASDRVIRVLKELGWSPIDIGNFLRANKASFDMSFWRQQAPLIFAHKMDFVMANMDAWNALFSQKAAEAQMQAIIHDPTGLYQIYEYCASEGGDFLRPLELPSGTAQWKGVEEFGYLTKERWIPRMTAKIPWIKLSSRAFISGCNSHNWRIFKQYYNQTLKLNEAIAAGKKKLRPGEIFNVQQEMIDFSKMLANFTARGSLGKAAPLAPALSSLLFAPRAKLGRILSIKDLVNSNPRVRYEAWKNMVSFVSVFGGLILLGNLLGLWEVEKDPRSAEFMSIRMGNTRVDVWGGYRQILTFATRLSTGTGISSVTGAEYDVNPIGSTTTFIRSSASPFASTIADFWTGKTFVGEEIDVANKKQWIERIAPFAIMDFYEAYMSDPTTAFQVAIPAILGAGVQTYTGDWAENYLKLGLPKYSENLVYGIKEPYYDVQDFWADTASQFKGVDPDTLTEEKGYPSYIALIAEAYNVILPELKGLPSEKLISINADPEKGTTYGQYYRMWLDREKIVASGDEDALEAFDKDERTRNAYMGNISQREYSLLVEYHSITDKQKQKEFLEKHPEININPRQDWLKNNPEENARLAVWGQAKILTREAYDEFKRLVDRLDIPDNAIPDLTLPPEESIDNYFTYNDLIQETSPNSWETQLLLARDDELRKWLGREPIESPVEALELKVKHRELFDRYEELETDEERKQLKEENPEWVDDIRRIEAYENNAGGDVVEKWVKRGNIIDEFGAGSSEAMVWLLDNPDIHKWALGQELLTDDGSDWNVPVLRINVKWREQDEEYEGFGDKDSPNYIEDDIQRADLRFKYLVDNPEYRKDRRRREAYSLKSPTGERFPERHIENYVQYYELPEKGYRRERFLLENQIFAKYMHDVAGIDLPDRDKVPSVKYDEIYEQYEKEFIELEGLSDHKSEFYIEDAEERESRRRQLRFDTRGEYTEFGLAELKRNGYGKFVPEKHINDYVAYYKIVGEGKPKNYDLINKTDLWYEDDWFMMEHSGFYKEVYLKILGNERKDYRKVPSRSVFYKYLKYLKLPKGKRRDDFRFENPDLDEWLVIKFDYTPIMEKIRGAELTAEERQAEEIMEIAEKMRVEL